MSDLRSKLIRLAHQNPELRADILPLLKEAGSKEAGGDGLIEYVLPTGEIEKAYRNLLKDDKQSAQLLMEVYYALQERLKLSDRENEAMNRLRRVISGRNAATRNDIFKAADALGMKLPSMMF